MKFKVWKLFALAAVALAYPSAVQAGWVEVGDAGPFYQGGAFQTTVGVGDLDTISGTTTIPGGVGVGTLFRELVDVYSIRVTDPDLFYATTDPDIDARASASADSRLYLLDPTTGDALLMNDDTDNVGLKSLIAEPATFTALTGNTVHESAENVELVAGQTYLLAVSEYAITPLDLTGVFSEFETGLPMVADQAYEGPPGDPLNSNGGVTDGNLSLVGAIRPAADDSDWGSNQQFIEPGVTLEQGIDYVVALRGATFGAVPEPSTLAIGLLAALGCTIAAMRRKLG